MDLTTEGPRQKQLLELPFWRFALLVLRKQISFESLFGSWRRQAESEPQRRIRLSMAAVALAERIIDIEPAERDKVVARALVLANLSKDEANDTTETFAS